MGVLAQVNVQVNSDNGEGILIFLFLIFACSVAGAFTGWVAEEKGRRGLTWFLLGFIFNILALLAVGLAPSTIESGRRGS